MLTYPFIYVVRLTVDEHLWFYAQMKGLSSRNVKKEMDQYVFTNWTDC